MSTSNPVLEANAQPEVTGSGSLRVVMWWGFVVGILQALSPAAFWWLDQDVVWAASLVVIAPVYIGLAVADGRPRVIAIESLVATVFIVVSLVAITVTPWLVVIGLIAHGLKDLWQHRTRFVANTRWWPPFCLVVDFVAAATIAAVLIA